MADVASEFRLFLTQTRKGIPAFPLPAQKRPGPAPRVAAALAALKQPFKGSVDSYLVTTETGSTDNGVVPLTLYRPPNIAPGAKLATILYLHATSGSQDQVTHLALRLVAKGFAVVTIDSRYHGERATSSFKGIGVETLAFPGTDNRTQEQHAKDVLRIYYAALERAYKDGNSMPFLLDTVWDIVKVVDWLTGNGVTLEDGDPRKTLDPLRLGCVGISLGGMHTWLGATADPRLRVIVPIIGVQSFPFSVRTDSPHPVHKTPHYRPRIDSILPPFLLAANGDSSKIDASLVKKVYERIAPGLLDRWDVSRTLPSLAPRPCLVLNGELDGRNWVEGIDGTAPYDTVRRTREAYDFLFFSEDSFEFRVFPGVGHVFTDEMRDAAEDWFVRFLGGSGSGPSL